MQPGTPGIHPVAHPDHPTARDPGVCGEVSEIRTDARLSNANVNE